MEVNLNVSALEKLLDYAASGIGSVAGPMLASWRARRDAEAKRIAAEGEVTAQNILAEGQSSALQTIASAQADARARLTSSNAAIRGELTIAETVEQRIQFQEEKRQGNIGAVVRQAAAQLGGKDVPDQEPDHDWTARFFSEIQDVSSEEMQLLWAKVLAGEVERPGSTSIKTLSILKNLDRMTAALFRKLCSACVSIKLDQNQFIDARVPSLGRNAASNGLREYGLDFGDLNGLNEHGLIISDYNSWFDCRACIGVFSEEAKPKILRYPFSFQGRFWVLIPTAKRTVNREFKLSGVALTCSGQELSVIVGLEPMDKYCQALMEYFKANHLQMTEVAGGQPMVLDSYP